MSCRSIVTRTLVSALWIACWMCTFSRGQTIPSQQQAPPAGAAAGGSSYGAEIPKADLLLTDNPDDPGSSAMILERSVYTDDEKRFQIESVRIKIFKEDGTKYADVAVPYRAKQMNVEDIRGRTVRADGSVIDFNGTVYDTLIAKSKRLSYQAKTFTLPGAEVGSVIEYSYTVRWKYRYPPYVGHPSGYMFDGGWRIPSTTWNIQDQLFTRHAIFQLKPVPGGNLNWRSVRLTQGEPMFVDRVLKLEVAKVPPLPEEEAMPPEQMINSRVHLYYSVGWGGGSQWYSYGKMMEQEYQKFLTPTSSLTRTANEWAPRDFPAEERLHRLYSRVQKLRFISDEPSKTEKELKAIEENKNADDILRHGYAFINEANLLFTALARAAGLDAYVVMVADRHEKVFDEGLDSSQLDAMIVMVKVDGKETFYDPAAHFCPFGQIPWYESDTGGVAWSKTGGFVVKVPYQAAGDALTERTADLVLQPDGTLSGSVEIVFRGQEALERKQDAAREDDNGRNKQIEDEIKNMLPGGTEVESMAVSGWESGDLPLRVKCRITVPAYATVGAHRMLFSPAVFQSQKRASFASRVRTQPVYYRHIREDKDSVTIALPNKYRLEGLPKDSVAGVEFARCEVKRSAEEGKIVMDRREQFKGYYFPASMFATLWSYRVNVRRHDAEKVVLHVAD